jgi:hypothetical protein
MACDPFAGIDSPQPLNVCGRPIANKLLEVAKQRPSDLEHSMNPFTSSKRNGQVGPYVLLSKESCCDNA